MKVLVINCGSSSLKYQLIDSDSEAVIAKGLCERIGIDGKLTHQTIGKDRRMVPLHHFLRSMQWVTESSTVEKSLPIQLS